MTISSTTNKVQFTGNGVTTSFSFPYVFFAQADLMVTLFNTSTNAAVSPAPVLNGAATYDYTISGTFDASLGEYPAGANVVFNTAPPATYRVTIERVVSPTQLVALVDGSRFPAQTVNGEFDKLTVLIQRAYQLIAQALYYPSSDPSTVSNILPDAATRASQYLGFDSSGNPVALGAPAGTTAVSSFWAAILLLTTAAASRLSLGFSAIAAKGNLWVGTALDTVGTLTVGSNGKVLAANSNTTTGLEWQGPFGNYLYGLITSRASATTIGVTAGGCMDSTNVQMLTVAGATINLAATGALGLDTGSLANNTWYHVYAIGQVGGTTSLIASTSVSTPSPMPSGYTLKRRIGSFKTNGSAQVIDFVQDGDLFQWVTLIQDVNTSNPGTSAVTSTLGSVPTGVNVIANIQGVVQNGDAGTICYAYFSDLATTDSTPIGNTTNPIMDGAAAANAGGAVVASGNRLGIRTNTSAQIRYRVSYSSANVRVTLNTLGWTDARGR